MAAFNIYIEGGFIYVTDVPVTLEFLRNPRGNTTFDFDEPNSIFKFYNISDKEKGTLDSKALGGDNYLFDYADLTAVTETIDGVPTIIPIANARALASYLSTKISFFFNDAPVEIAAPVDGLPTQDYLIGVGEGLYPDRSIVIISGRNADVDTSVVDIGMADIIFPWLTTAATMEAISDDAADDAGGLGARVITVQGLNATFDLIEEDITMNGTSATIATTALFIRINRVIVKETGTYAATGTGSNTGNITIRVSGGGATQSFISNDIGGAGFSQDVKYTIPNNHIAIVLGVGFNVSSSKIGKLVFNTRAGADIVAAPFTTRVVSSIIDGESGRNDVPREELGSTLPEKTDIWGSAIATAVNTEISARIALLLIDQS